MKRLNIFLSPIAEYKLEGLVNYLELEFGEPSKQNFIKLFTNRLISLSEYPKGAQSVSGLSGVFKSVVTKQTSVFFRVNGDNLEVLTITDNRQDPKKILDELKALFGKLG